jgi:hypothetical protein
MQPKEPKFEELGHLTPLTFELDLLYVSVSIAKALLCAAELGPVASMLFVLHPIFIFSHLHLRVHLNPGLSYSFSIFSYLSMEVRVALQLGEAMAVGLGRMRGLVARREG